MKIIAKFITFEAKSLALIEQLFKTHYARLVRLGYYLVRNQQIAEDLSQELFLKLIKNPDQLNRVTNVGAYLSVSIRNAAMNYLNNSKESTSEIPDMLVESDDNHAEEVALKIRKIKEGMSKLAPQTRLVFSLSRFEGLTNQEIADYLEISKRTVETQISKAVLELRKQVNHSG